MHTSHTTHYSVQTVVQTQLPPPPPSSSSSSSSSAETESSVPERLSLVLRLPPLPSASHSSSQLMPSGQAPVQRMGRAVGAEGERQIGTRLKQLMRMGAEQKLAELLIQIEAQVPAEQREEWQRWLGDWQQAQMQGRESARLLLLGMLFCRVMQPALESHRTVQDKEQCKQLISALWSVLQQFLPQGKWVKDFLNICEEAWSQHVRNRQHSARQQITMAQIIAEICTLSTSSQRQQQLEQWIEELLAMPSEDTGQQVRHCAVLIVRYLRPLLKEIDPAQTAQRLCVAKIEENLCMWMEAQLPQGQSIETFLQQCREGLIEEAVLRVHFQQLDAVTAEQRNALHHRTQAMQQQMQASGSQIQGGMRQVQHQRQAVLTASSRMDHLSNQLEEQSITLHAQLARTGQLAEQEELLQERLRRQANQLQEEAGHI